MSKAYMSLALITELGVNVMGIEKHLPVKDHADGLIGVLPVFESEEAARAYSDRDITIMDITDPSKEDTHGTK